MKQFLSFFKKIENQIILSLVVLAIYGSYYFLVFDHGGVAVSIEGQGEPISEMGQSSEQEITWEILIVDPRLREKLWEKYRQSDEKEREKAFFAVLIMIDSLSPDQAEHVARGMINYSGDTKSIEHRDKLNNVLVKIGSRFKNTLSTISQYALTLIKDKMNLRKIDQAREMVQKIENTIKESPYKYCLKGNNQNTKECATEMVRERTPKNLDDLWGFRLKQKEAVQAREVIIVMARTQDPRPKEEVPKLLDSTYSKDILLALDLIRIYRMSSFIPALREVKQTTPHNFLKVEIEATIQYLTTPQPGGPKSED